MPRQFLALVVLLAACGGTTEATTTSSSALAADGDDNGGYLVWISNDGLFVSDMDTLDIERIGPADGSMATQPTPGPTGQLAWSELVPGGGKIVTRLQDGTVSRLDGPTVPFYYSWSPDGTALAFLGPGSADLIFGVVENGAAREIDSGAPYYFDWAPDSQALFVHRVGQDLSLLTLDGQRVVIDESPSVFQAPHWSDRGVTYASPGAGSFAQGGVLLVSGDEPSDLVTAASPGDAPTLVATLGAFSAFDRAGNRIAVLSFDSPPTGTLTVFDVESGSVDVVAREVLAHRWSPDGDKLLVLTSNDDGLAVWSVWDTNVVTELVTFVPTTTFVREYLPFWDQYSRSLTPWSPASDAFTFAGEIDGETDAGIYVQYLDGQRTRIADGRFSAWGRSGP